MTAGTQALLAAAAISGALAATAPARANPVGQTYLVTVTPSAGPPFGACFSFDTMGDLAVTGYPGTVIYGFKNATDRPSWQWQAVPTLAAAKHNRFNIQWNGIALGAASGYMRGWASNDHAEVFVFAGPAVRTCPAAIAADPGASPWER